MTVECSMRQLRFQIRTFKGFPCLIRNLVSHSNTRHTRQYWMTIFDGLSHVVFKTIALRCTRIHQYSTLRLATDIAVFKYICGTIATGVFGRGNNAFGASCRLKQSLFGQCTRSPKFRSFVQICVCSIESGPCERVDVFHVSGRFWSTSACGEKRTPARPAWTSFPS